ncbi:hypothetical protein HGH93_28370 [Chitinophaga polysaccharea]|uniref:hypothetical protein n=1 Tax=Chitinophaga TaxID=79328 RepID=UPI001455A107|nr:MULTISPECIES: hypothetical protein [Chitinophaga]NLR62043.1 hypothetical protein [Chitinophaga polysaccharea]NLU94592.1 hypothetical protein [Chitinophaga sp. Ak27]
MQELIQQLQEKAGLTPEQAVQSIDVIKEYVKGKLPPFIAGTVDNWFAGMSGKAEDKKPGLMDQASDFLEDVKDKAEDWAEEAKEKVSDFFKDKK